MGKYKKSHNFLLSSWLDKEVLHKKYFRIESGHIFCDPCSKLYDFKQYSQLQQHVNSETHKRNSKQHDQKPERQLLLTETQNTGNQFFEDLCTAFVAADIPWVKLSNPTLQAFLEKYMQKSIPDESTLRKHYLKKVYIKSIDKIREAIGNLPIWLSVDETTDSEGRYVANVLIGPLRKDKFSESHLILCKELPKTNNSTITKLVLDTFGMLWPDSNQSLIDDRFLLFLTDGVPYMKLAGDNLKALYPKLIHVTCLAHGVNRVAEEVRSHYPDVDKLIGAVKAVFRKAPSRILLYKEKYPELELPPAPIYTRWGTWLEAVDFYTEHWEKIKTIVNSLNNEAKCVETAKEYFNKPNLFSELSYISANFTFLAIILKKLQERNISLSEAISIVAEAKTGLVKVKGTVGTKVYSKIMQVTDKNMGFKQLTAIAKVLDGEAASNDVPILINPAKVAAFKYAPITSVEVERSFSMHKSLLSQRRRRFTMENIEMSLVSHYALLD